MPELMLLLSVGVIVALLVIGVESFMKGYSGKKK